MTGHLCTVEFRPSGGRIRLPAGGTILDAARSCETDPGIDATCGGRGECGQCLVRVSGAVSGPDAVELGLPAGMRLACRVRILGDVVVEVADRGEQFQIDGCSVAITSEPGFRRIPLSLDPAASDRSDIARIADALGIEGIRFDIEGLRSVVRLGEGFSGRVVIRDQTVTGLHPDGPPLGLAVDLGTTKIAGYLLNLETGTVVGSGAVSNPQSRFGSDIMTRLEYGCRSASGARELTDAIRAGVTRVAEEICSDARHSPTDILELVVCANTAMHHMFSGLDLRGLASAPFTPVTTDPIDMSAVSAGLAFSSGARIHMVSPVAGFVGGDHTAMLLATELASQPGTVVGIDVGTNTEISLCQDGVVTCCSCASGPAFEGAHIGQGMRASDGAIDRVWLSEGQVRCHVIGNVIARGFCGGGLIDLLSVLLDSGRLDPTGRLSPDAAGNARWSLGPVELGQNDVRQLQLAKAAIRAGIEQLMSAAGVDSSDVDRVYVAGAFGNAIDPRSAIRIGMFPPIDPGRFVSVGNAAGMGAQLCLLSVSKRREAARLAHRIRHLELARTPGYSDSFIRYLNFPHGGEI